ncbi:hypothetical protein GCM10009030_15600 [Haloarcula pellucida]|uniref:Uncharacterized protein n=1 Tax=Haloarcula pellucida TaxID=1427151 RepID=A0A830GKL7_9EURY|nr:hypothetical protein GCM10009030_15600 [Halomicroarcula pellucida]
MHSGPRTLDSREHNQQRRECGRHRECRITDQRRGANRYGVCDTSKYGETPEVIEKSENPRRAGDGRLRHAYAGYRPRPPPRPAVESRAYEISDDIGLLHHSGRTIDAIRTDGWRNDIGYLEDRDEAERRLEGEVDPELVAENIAASE